MGECLSLGDAGFDLPCMTHLQFLIVQLLLASIWGSLSATGLRKKLAEYGFHRSGPAFYQMLGRMIKCGYIEAVTVNHTAATGRHTARTIYRPLDAGREACGVLKRLYRPWVIEDLAK